MSPAKEERRLSYSTPERVRSVLEERLRAELASMRESLPLAAPVMSLRSGWNDGTAEPSKRRAWPRVFRTGSMLDGWAVQAVEASTTSRVASVGETLSHLERLASAMARQEADRIGLALHLVHPVKIRPAVLERLLPRWPWWTVNGFTEETAQGFAILRALLDMRMAWRMDSAHPGSSGVFAVATAVGALFGKLPAFDISNASLSGLAEWPPDVSTLDALLWVRDGLNRCSKGWGNEYDDKARAWAEKAPVQIAPLSLDFRQSSDDPEHLYVLGYQFAWAYSAVAGVERGQRERAFKLPANKHAHTVASMFVRPPSVNADADLWPAPVLRGADLVLEWNGKRTPYQLELHADAGGDVNNEIARGLVAELGPDALRDWLALHRSTSEQGSSGSFIWTWEEHRERTHYADRVRKGKARDADLARATRQRIWRFKQAELWASDRAADGRVYRYRIGPFGLVDVDREILEADGKTPAVVGGRFNPDIYGSRGKARAAGFTLLPDAALRLPDAELRIAVSAFYAMRHEGGNARMKAKRLWDYAGLAEGQRKDKRRWPQCRAVTERTLDALSSIGIRWAAGGALPDDVYEFTAPDWWTDRLVHRVGPVLTGPATVGVPRTGLDLAAMRKARGLSQRAVADVVGASQPTVMRAEKSPEALPAAWLPKLAEARLTMPG